MTAPRSGKYAQDTESPSPSPLAGFGPGGHRPSFRSTKLAKRARSFKDDFLEKISQMRSPANSGVRAQSPKAPTSKSDALDKGPVHELDHLFKQIRIALKHFRDVVSKKKLEMLPGNGTIVLDTIWAINLSVQRSTVCPESSSSITSATHHMYQSVAKLIKLCDDALIDDQSAVLDEGNVEEVVALVEESVQALIKLVQEKITSQTNNGAYRTTPRTSYGAANLDMPAQRNSLPDIPLTPRERQILEQNCRTPGAVRSSHSTESVLRDSSPPPKPPLPHGAFLQNQEGFMTPPPLPPKKRNLENNYVVCFNSDSSIFASSLERMSLRSKSPEDSSSLLSASAGSLDSVLNNSREEEEIRAIMDRSVDNDGALDNDSSDVAPNDLYSWDDSFLNSALNSTVLNQSSDLHANNIEYNRLSNTDSGFISVRSHRNSSYSKRSSQQSSSSSGWSPHQNSIKQNAGCAASEVHVSDSVLRNLKSFTDSQTTVKSVHCLTHKSSTAVSSFSSSQKNVLMNDKVDFGASDDPVPPAVPQKTKRKQERQPSPYDNVPDTSPGGELLVTCQMHQTHQSSSSNTSITSINRDSSRPPPLPPKKKHMFQSVAYSVMAYMEMFGNCSHSSDQEFMRHSVHLQGHWVQPSKVGLSATQSCSFSHSSSSSRSSQTQIQTLALPHSSEHNSPTPSPIRSPSSVITPVSSTGVPPALPPKRSRSTSTKSSPPATPQTAALAELKSPVKSLPDLLEHTVNLTSPKPDDQPTESSDCNLCDIDLMEETDVTKYLLFKTIEEDGPEIRGGCVDALIIRATKASRNGVFAYQEAFLTTYRTFIAPLHLVDKLIQRFTHFYCQPDKKPKEAFALIIRVVSDLTPSDLDNKLQQMLMDFVQQLISCGEITLAKALRVKHLERHDAKQLSMQFNAKQNSISGKRSPLTLLDFKSEQIAEQMTYLDAELFMKIEIPEVLVWAQEQNEERSPNLTRFTEHFNKMSYWARTMILQADAKDRERYFMKFIKIMKHLRKINNFNSYLALLSALDSAPVRRLEWQKHVQEGLKEYCALIDSSSSFRAYRQALADTQPPCIPYIGLVLQDLTFVHIGNSHLLPNGFINFSKRWQQFNIVENMKRFKKCAYSFKKNEKIVDFFQNFNDHINEDAMWQLSETIKPRGKKTTTQ